MEKQKKKGTQTDSLNNCDNYYIVTCMGGHVGYGKYKEMNLTIIADNADNARRIALNHKNIKQGNNNPILWVASVDKEAFEAQEERNSVDIYYRLRTKEQFQRWSHKIDGVYTLPSLLKKLKNKTKRQLQKSRQLQTIVIGKKIEVKKADGKTVTLNKNIYIKKEEVKKACHLRTHAKHNSKYNDFLKSPNHDY
jgi:hypothetical protein